MVRVSTQSGADPGLDNGVGAVVVMKYGFGFTEHAAEPITRIFPGGVKRPHLPSFEACYPLADLDAPPLTLPWIKEVGSD